jgi:AbrB family looped-hinge helix DNA binding protein
MMERYEFMGDMITVQVSQRGVLVLPKSLRDSYNLQPGDTLTLLDLGGVFVLSPRRSQIDPIAERLREALVEQGQSLESVLKLLREKREAYGEQG